MNFSMFMSIFYFIKELIFNKNTRSSVPIKIRRWLILILIVVSLTLNYFTITKVVKLTTAYIALDKEKKKLIEELNKRKQCEVSMKTFKELLDSCK